MPYSEAMGIATTMAWTKSEYWQKNGKYDRNSMSPELRAMMEPWRAAPDLLRKLLSDL